MAGRIQFGDTRMTPPEWMADFGSRDHLIPGGIRLDPAQFIGPNGTRVTLTAGAALGATALAVAALAAAIPSGTVLDFGGAKFARLTAAAAAGATALQVAALPTALNTGDSAVYAGVGALSVPSGTALGRTFAERDAGTPFGPTAAGDEEVFLLAFEVTDLSTNADGVAYRPGSVVKENFLPGWTGLTAAVKALIRDRYICQRGSE